MEQDTDWFRRRAAPDGFFFLNTHFFTMILRAGQKRSKGRGVFSRDMIARDSENKAVSDNEKILKSFSTLRSGLKLAEQANGSTDGPFKACNY
jgi:hypothetical protein